MPQYINLHNHSSHSVLDGLGNPDAWVEAAVEKGFSALAITDHASVSCALEFVKAAKEKGVQPIVGCEFYVTDDPGYRPKRGEPKMVRYHLLVLAKDYQGLCSIFRQLTLANAQYYYRPLLAMSQIHDFEHCIVSTACAIGIVQHPDWEKIIPALKETYKDDFYLEIMAHQLESQLTINQRVLAAAELYGIKPIATNDAHYPNAQDFETHDVLLSVQTNAKLSDPKRFSFRPLKDLYLKNTSEMIAAFVPWIKDGVLTKEFVLHALCNTEEVAAKCVGLELPKLNFALPCPAVVKRGGVSEIKFLMTLCQQGWERLIRKRVSASAESRYVARLQHELKVVSGIGAVRYFLIVWDIVAWAKRNGILCGFGRGSAGGSLICYLLGIHNLDPIAHELYFERFLRADRIDMPDIDLDFAGKDRELVIQYIRAAYGADHVCQISTSGMMHGKSAFRDVARVHEINHQIVNDLSKRIDNDIPLADNFTMEPTLAAFAAENPEIIRHAVRLDGQLRSKGVHAGGVVISEDGFGGRGVLEHRKDAKVINWEMGQCENWGLLKVDILGLNNLSVLNETARLIEKTHKAKVDYFSIYPDDPEVFKLFSEGLTAGFFQFESSGITGLCKRLAPIQDFETLIHINALYRPGPLDSGMVESYVARKAKMEAVFCPHPKMEPIVEQTFGLPIFQEQVMRLFVDLAGFTWPEADTMRKIISKSKGSKMLEEKRTLFVEGCTESSGIDPSVSNRVYDEIVKFGRYGFNKSHSACYSLIGYLTAWAKRYYPLEFMCALLRAVIGETDTTAKYVTDARRMGLDIRGPDINLSQDTFSINREGIIAGFSSIKGIGPAAAREIFRAREAGGPFKTYVDFLERTQRCFVKKNVINALAKAGAFARLEPNSKWIMDTYAELIMDLGTWKERLPDPRHFDDHSDSDKFAMRMLSVPGVFSSEDVECTASMEIDTEALAVLQAQIKACRDCPIGETRAAEAPCSIKFTRASQLLVVTDFPGSREEARDEPLQNPEMMALFNMVCGLTPGKLFKAHLYHCPPVGRKIEKEIEEACKCGHKWMARIIKTTEANVIFSMGAKSYSYFSGKPYGITKANATAEWNPTLKAMVVYCISPGSLHYDASGEKKDMMMSALKKLKTYL